MTSKELKVWLEGFLHGVDVNSMEQHPYSRMLIAIKKKLEEVEDPKFIYTEVAPNHSHTDPRWHDPYITDPNLMPNKPYCGDGSGDKTPQS